MPCLRRCSRTVNRTPCASICKPCLPRLSRHGWTLYRESGTQGGRATLKRDQYLERDEAIAAFEKMRDATLKRGFRVMFAQGLDGPYGRR